jgi:very-short-patch-repair endonuclease
MRHHPSEAEAALWRLLSGGQLGASFRRQLVLGGAIADFACPSARLVVEVDGATHGLASARRADARRDRKLAALGWRVLRVSAAELRSEPHTVVARVREALRAPP